jgi:hypothetical protein
VALIQRDLSTRVKNPIGNGKWIRIPEINVDWKASMAMVENTIMDKGFYQQ